MPNNTYICMHTWSTRLSIHTLVSTRNYIGFERNTSWRGSCSGAGCAIAWFVRCLVKIGLAFACLARGGSCGQSVTEWAYPHYAVHLRATHRQNMRVYSQSSTHLHLRPHLHMLNISVLLYQARCFLGTYMHWYWQILQQSDCQLPTSVGHNCFYYTSKPECAIPDDNNFINPSFSSSMSPTMFNVPLHDTQFHSNPNIS